MVIGKRIFNQPRELLFKANRLGTSTLQTIQNGIKHAANKHISPGNRKTNGVTTTKIHFTGLGISPFVNRQGTLAVMEIEFEYVTRHADSVVVVIWVLHLSIAKFTNHNGVPVLEKELG